MSGLPQLSTRDELGVMGMGEVEVCGGKVMDCGEAGCSKEQGEVEDWECREGRGNARLS